MILDENMENVDENDNEFFDEAMERLDLSKEAFSKIHQDYKDDVSFGLLGVQWTAETLGRRKRDNRTVAVFNKCVPMIRHVVNSNMQNPPAIVVRPISNDKKEESDIIEGIVRNSEDKIYPGQQVDIEELPFECELHHFKAEGFGIETCDFVITRELVKQYRINGDKLIY